MTVAAFHVLNNRKIYSKLVEELEARFPNQTEKLPFVELEKLPYLVSQRTTTSLHFTLSNGISLRPQ